jgi:hypothetical protein
MFVNVIFGGSHKPVFEREPFPFKDAVQAALEVSPRLDHYSP